MLGLGDNLAQSVAALRAYRLRSALTITGLVMGVATIISVVSLIRGANHYVENKVVSLGTNVFQIAKTPLVSVNFAQMVRSAKNRKVDAADLAAVAAACGGCEAVGATVAGLTAVRRGNAEVADAQLLGHTASMAEIDSRVVETGRYFTQGEEERGAPVCLLGDRVRTELFGGSNPLGSVVRVGPEEFTVVGTFEKFGAVLGQDADTFVVVPLSAFARQKGARHSLTLSVKVAAGGELASVLDEVRQLLRARRHVAPGQPDDFFSGTKDGYIALWSSMSQAFFVAFVLVSGVTGTVGGVVIMNVMLMSVLERTKEIGLRRALGASQGDIRRQFLTESLLQCLVGGVVGVAAGFGVAWLVSMATGYPVRVEAWMAGLGLTFSTAVGLFFGMAPAMRAARLDPVEALRSE